MKTGKVVVVLVGGAFIIGALLSSKFPKFGLGGGWGLGSGEPRVQSAGEPAKSSSGPTDDVQIAGALAGEKPALLVRISGTEYAVLERRGGQESYHPVTLEEVVQLAKTNPEDEYGIRIHVARAPKSKAGAELKLQEALVEAGIRREAINWQNGSRP